jgi:uncharacterized membrane protein SpoIIM required for sporulation
MVFESILSPKEVRKHPWKTLILGMVYSTVAIIVANWVFPSDPSLSMVFLATMTGIPLLVSVLRIEEKEDFSQKQYPLIGNHKDVLGVIFFMFLGLLISFTAWYIILPEADAQRVFNAQINTIQDINSFTNIQGNYVKTDFLKIILVNNFKVLFFCLVFSLLYGAGALFIITWNSSVLGTAIGNAIKTNLNLTPLAIPMGFGQYMIHGIPEIIAYLLGAIAGGIISIAVIRRKPDSKKFKEVITDSIDLIILASIMLIISGLIEVYISMGA